MLSYKIVVVSIVCRHCDDYICEEQEKLTIEEKDRNAAFTAKVAGCVR